MLDGSGRSTGAESAGTLPPAVGRGTGATSEVWSVASVPVRGAMRVAAVMPLQAVVGSLLPAGPRQAHGAVA